MRRGSSRGPTGDGVQVAFRSVGHPRSMATADLLRRRNRTAGALAAVVVLGLVVAVAWFGARSAAKASLARTNLTPTPSGAPAAVPKFSHVFTIVLENHSSGSSTVPRHPISTSSWHGTGWPRPTRGWPTRRSRTTWRCSAARPRGSPTMPARPGRADDRRSARGCRSVVAGLRRERPDRLLHGAEGRRRPGRHRDLCSQARPGHQLHVDQRLADALRQHPADVGFDPAAADYSLIVPNLCNDAHDCPLSTADAWLKNLVPRILDSPAWKDGGVLFITFDEADGQDRQANRVATLVIAPSVVPGTRSSVPHTHYSLLRTVQDGLGLDLPGAELPGEHPRRILPLIPDRRAGPSGQGKVGEGRHRRRADIGFGVSRRGRPEPGPVVAAVDPDRGHPQRPWPGRGRGTGSGPRGGSALGGTPIRSKANAKLAGSGLYEPTCWAVTIQSKVTPSRRFERRTGRRRSW